MMEKDEYYKIYDLIVTVKSLKQQVQAVLKCRYLSENHAFTKIGPLKFEELFLEPQILLIHDIITDFEIEHILEVAAQHMNTVIPLVKRYEEELQPVEARIFEGKWIIDTNYRATKLHWIAGALDHVVANIMRRGKYISGLNIDLHDNLQVGNYGLGGHFDKHHDFINKGVSGNEYCVSEERERVATVMYYLSDVELGGSTVFPVLGVGMKPTKNQAIYWENLYPSGKGRLNTLHAACPVLLGSKWIATHWIHRKYQELIRPCNLQPDDEDYDFYADLN